MNCQCLETRCLLSREGQSPISRFARVKLMACQKTLRHGLENGRRVLHDDVFAGQVGPAEHGSYCARYCDAWARRELAMAVQRIFFEHYLRSGR